MSGRTVCEHSRDVEEFCPECEAEGEAYRAEVRTGEKPCPICGQNCAEIITELQAEVKRLTTQVRRFKEIVLYFDSESEDEHHATVAKLLAEVKSLRGRYVDAMSRLEIYEVNENPDCYDEAEFNEAREMEATQ